MINYSLSERYSIVGDKTSPLRTYAKAQPLKVMELDELACSTIMITLAESVYFNVTKETTSYGVW